MNFYGANPSSKSKKGEPCGDVVHDILFKIDGD
jgi:hypothetical protein